MRNNDKFDKKKDYRDESETKPKGRKKDYKQKYNHINYWLEEDAPDLNLN